MFWLIVVLVIAGPLVYSLWIEPRRIRIRKRRIDLQGPPMRPLEILHLSDLHFNPGQVAQKNIIQRIAEVPVDLVFITGDFIDGTDGIEPCLEILRPLRARYGIFCVLGNHDYYRTSWRNLMHRTGDTRIFKRMERNDIDRLVAGLKDLGITVLRNERKTVTIENHSITIAGLDDPYTERGDIGKTFDRYTKNGPCLVLSHAPEPYKQLADLGADLVFCGHTHGGQIRIPFFGALITRTLAPRPLAYGLNRIDQTLIYTTSGMGTSHITPPRFLCPPEVNFFTIHFNPANRLDES